MREDMGLCTQNRSYTIKLVSYGNSKKVRYFNYFDLFHSGQDKSKGYSMHTEKEAKKLAGTLNKILIGAWTAEVIHHDEMPFIKKQHKRKP